MKRRLFSAFVLGMAMFVPTEGGAQTSETQPGSEGASPAAPETPAGAAPPPPDGTPATPQPEAATEPAPAVPPVEVVQPRERPTPRVERVTVPARRAPAQPAPLEPQLDLPSEITEPPPGYYGPPGGIGNFERMMHSSQSPIVPNQGIVPGDLSDFSSAGSRVTRQKINEQDPLTTNDILSTIPGVAIINDDGLGRHGGISIRGSPARRSRKILVMEDGRSINQSLWLDPSTHYVPPPERVQEVEVLRGTVIMYGPNNNHGVVNFRNLQPFGPNETVATAQGGSVAQSGGVGEERSLNLDNGDASQWHVHTRQTAGDWGLVLSYTGANAQGAWNTERLRFNDFYGALGWKGEKSDFTFSTVYFAQRDNYDESNLEGEDEDRPGQVERNFFNNIKHCKTCFNPGSTLNEYNADLLLLQGVYNYYINQDTTISWQTYGQTLTRNRYFNFEGEDPRAVESSFKPFIQDGTVFIPEGVMEGRLRNYDNWGTELRTELANRPFLFGWSQDMMFGVRYEFNYFTDKNILGNQGEILNDFDSRGLTFFHRQSEANAVSAFFQTDIEVTERLSVVPGARVDSYSISRRTLALSGDDDDELDECETEDGTPVFDGEECVIVEGFSNKHFTEKFDRTHVLPGVAFAYGFGRKEMPADYGSKSLKPVEDPSYLTTLYGGYHRGLTMGVLREAAFPPGDELGNNFQLGLRSTALKGITFDVAGFHQRIQDYQIKSATTDAAGNNVYTLIDEVHINGFEAYGRLDSRPFTGWRLNPYLEGSYTLAENIIEKGFNEDGESVAGNFVPEVPKEFSYLTVGIESVAGWNASVSWQYRGGFYTDEDNTPFGGDPEGENGFVPSVWLLNARANYTIPGTDAVIFVSGQNLTDELYITDREDGIKPGIGRTVMGGARVKW
jgi:Fe(3+) dicitrate transport protein